MKERLSQSVQNIGRLFKGSPTAALLFGTGVCLGLTGIHLLHVSPHHTLSAWITACAALMLLGGISVISQSTLRERLVRQLVRIASWLDVDRAQVILILMGLLLSMASRAAAGDGQQVHSPLAAPLWMAGIVFTLLGCRQKGQDSGQKQVGRQERSGRFFELLLVALLFLGSLALRGWMAGRAPYVLSGDEGSAGLTGWEFLEGERDNLLGLGWFSFPALYFWLLSISQSILGRSVEAIRWVSALGGAFTVVAVYWTGRALWNRRVATWSALWLSTFHHHIFFSRVAYNNIWDGLFFILAAGALWAGVQRSRHSLYLLAGLALGFSQYFYTTARLGLLVLILWALHLSLRDRGNAARLPGMTRTALTAASVAMPLVLLYADRPEMLLFTSSRVSMLVPGWLAEAAAALGTTPVGLILEQTWVTFLGLSVAELQGVYYGSGVPLLFGLSTLLVGAGLVWALVRLRDPRCSLLWLTLAGTIIVGGLSIQAPNAQRMLLLPPVLALAAGCALESIYQYARRHLPTGRSTIIPLLTAFLLVSMVQNLRFFFFDYLPREQYGSLNGEVTQAMIDLLQAEPGQTYVYFIGGDRMAFHSIPSLPYLLPQIEGESIAAVSDLPKELVLPRRTALLIVLPEHFPVLGLIQERFSSETPVAIYNRYGRLLFYLARIKQP